MAIQSVPVQTEVFEIRDTPVKVEFSIDVFQGLVFDSETEVEIYSVNGVAANFFKKDILDLLDGEIRSHKAKLGKYSEDTNDDLWDDHFQNGGTHEINS